MVKFFKLHKYAGLLAGAILMLLGITGFLLDHDGWNYNYKIKFDNVPKSLLENEKRLFEAYYVDKDIIYVGGRRGLFKSINEGKSFTKEIDTQVRAISKRANVLFLATNSGILTLNINEKEWKPFLLDGKNITSMNIFQNRIIAVIEKQEIVVIDTDSKAIMNTFEVNIPESQLKHEITLSRFVRDLHYGRGLFDGISSLLINDYGAIVLTLLGFLGYLIWFMLKRIKSKNVKSQTVKSTIKLHANSFTILAIIPMFILAVTGIFLDHSNALRGFMSSVKVPYSILPPVYSSLKTDIWSADFDGVNYRIGNRQGVYKSKDTKEWVLESRGFAYRMIRKNSTLYVSGMGAANRILENSTLKVLPRTPHMFKDVVISSKKTEYLGSNSFNLPMPVMKDVTFFSVVLSLHDGTFFADWWVWINDIVSILLIVLSITGVTRWMKRKKLFHTVSSSTSTSNM